MNNPAINHDLEHDVVEDWELEYNAFCDEEDFRNESFYDKHGDY